MAMTYRLCIPTFFFLLGAWGLAPAQSLDGPGIAYFEKGKTYFDASDFYSAEMLFREGVRLEPNNSLGLFYLGKSIIALRPKDQEALEVFRKVHNLSPQSSEGTEAFLQIKRLETIFSAERQKQAEVQKLRNMEVSSFEGLASQCFSGISTTNNVSPGHFCVCFGTFEKGKDLRSDRLSFKASYNGQAWSGNYFQRWHMLTEGVATNFYYNRNVINIHTNTGPDGYNRNSYYWSTIRNQTIKLRIEELVNYMPYIWMDPRERVLMTDQGRMKKGCSK
ncbi:tetratricopeptide repeat protein [Rhizobium sp. C4]|uniref:tetratricopeptide repeat protein n=1 Tax=Rhizobium sp. C4 TaxID=1349800 RepID=UPI001E4F4F63|nr:hypothetical protein [Rhizobium sp. C4]MCD2174221.1 hypothetical protein [Rhizobium sp. C4]